MEARCGMHALNNVVGEHIFTPEHLAAAVHIFLEENPGLHDTPSDHIGGGGWYSAEVLATALQSVALEKYDQVVWDMPLLPISDAAQVVATVGVLQHRPGPPAHWIPKHKEFAGVRAPWRGGSRRGVSGEILYAYAFFLGLTDILLFA